MAVTPFDIANFNLMNFAQAYGDIFDSTPKTVDIQVMNDQGAITTETIENRGMFKQQIWDDVGGALGQFNRTFYVDADNGDDNNDGSSDAPFATIKKAVDSVPIGGAGTIYLQTANNIINEDIETINKTIIISGYYIDSSSTDPAIENVCYTDDYGNATYGFVMINSYLAFIHLTIRTADYADSSKKESYYAGFIKRWGTQSKNKVIIDQASMLIGDTDFIRLSDRQNIDLQVYYYDDKHSVTDRSIDCVGANNNGYLLNNEGSTMILSVASGRLGTKNDGKTNLTYSDLVNGIVKDSNGVPRNILSNVVF